MYRYDALEAPDPKKWLAAEERYRIHLVEEYHQHMRVELPELQLHAALHVIIENQVALGEDVPVRTLQRLQEEGLDRHDSIHAIAMVLIEIIPEVLDEDCVKTPEFAALFYSALESLTAESWLHSMDDEDDEEV